MTKLSFSGAVVLITGAANGIGRAMAKEAIHRGAIVIAVDLDETGLDSLKATSPEDQLVTHVASSTNLAQVQEIVSDTLQRFHKLDVAIANAGIEKIHPTWSMPVEDFEAVINVNVLGVYRTLQPCFKPIIESGGHMLAVSSIAGLLPFPFGAAYSSSKAAVDMLMRILRMELLATNATAGAAYFGFISSDMGDRVTSHPGVKAISRWLPRRLLGLTPILPPDVAARRVMNSIERRRGRTYTPGMIRFTYAMRGLMSLSDDFLGRYVIRLPRFIENYYGLPNGKSLSEKKDKPLGNNG